MRPHARLLLALIVNCLMILLLSRFLHRSILSPVFLPQWTPPGKLAGLWKYWNPCSLTAHRSSHVDMASTVTPEAAKAAPEPPKLPKLSGAQFREYNRLAEHMDFFVRTPLTIPQSSQLNWNSATA